MSSSSVLMLIRYMHGFGVSLNMKEWDFALDNIWSVMHDFQNA
jgi:hypothetical protein